jgi:hypothetical protein
MQNRFNRVWAIPVSILIIVGLYYVPPIHSRLAWRLESLRTQIRYLVKPPDEAVFQPTQQAQLDLAVTKMIQTLQTTLTPEATRTPKPGPTAQPTVTTTPLPATVMLENVKYEHQHGRLNYCGPANFSMALTYWGWNGNRDVIGKAVKPTDKDKNVMPYELQDYIIDNVPGMSTCSSGWSPRVFLSSWKKASTSWMSTANLAGWDIMPLSPGMTIPRI